MQSYNSVHLAVKCKFWMTLGDSGVSKTTETWRQGDREGEEVRHNFQALPNDAPQSPSVLGEPG